LFHEADHGQFLGFGLHVYSEVHLFPFLREVAGVDVVGMAPRVVCGPTVLRGGDVKVGVLFPALPAGLGQFGRLSDRKPVGPAPMMMHIVDQGNVKVATDREKVRHVVDPVIVFQGESFSDPNGELTEMVPEATQGGSPVTILSATVNVNDLCADLLCNKALVLEFANGAFRDLLPRRRKQDELVGMKAQANMKNIMNIIGLVKKELLKHLMLVMLMMTVLQRFVLGQMLFI